MKIAILTLYYNNRNYGGLLQAFALENYISQLGFECEQLQYLQSTNGRIQLSLWEKMKRNGVQGSLLKITSKIRKKSGNQSISNVESEAIKDRNSKFDEFRLKKILHSKVVYTEKTIQNASEEYDAFIVGSDQVWKPYILSDAFLLNFTKKPKIGYAISMGVNSLFPAEVKYIKPRIDGFQGISVREDNLVQIFDDQLGMKTEFVVDPVFLLEKGQWSAIAGHQVIEKPYMLCYFLGGVTKERQREMIEVSRKIHAKIVFLPNLNPLSLTEDQEFGDVRLYSVGPREFVALIRDANYVFTDSFHAVAFSEIFQKEFAVYERKDERAMLGRIRSILHLFGDERRLVASLQDMHDISEQHVVSTAVCQIIEDSKRFLANNLKSISRI